MIRLFARLFRRRPIQQPKAEELTIWRFYYDHRQVTAWKWPTNTVFQRRLKMVRGGKI